MYIPCSELSLLFPSTCLSTVNFSAWLMLRSSCKRTELLVQCMKVIHFQGFKQKKVSKTSKYVNFGHTELIPAIDWFSWSMFHLLAAGREWSLTGLNPLERCAFVPTLWGLKEGKQHFESSAMANTYMSKWSDIILVSLGRSMWYIYIYTHTHI